MRESILMAPMYIALFGTPILMFMALLSYLFYSAALPFLQILIIIGLIVFGVSGIREVYLQKHTLRGRSVEVNLYGKGIISDDKSESIGNNKKEVTLNLSRFNMFTTQIEKYTYKINVDKFTTVLDALLQVKEKKDNSLSMRYSCRMGICGSCGMVINGKPALACECNILKNVKDGQIEVGPMQAHPILKDLVNDFDDFFSKHSSMKPYLYRKDKEEQYLAKKEYVQSQEQIEQFLPYSYCIMCGLCMDACPIVNTNPDFIGPQPLSQVYRYYADSRDQLKDKRIEKADVIEGLWSCEFAGACSKVCPKGVDPATAIQLLKSEAMKSNIIKKE
jgi:succinate dehydrogenase / fumarate reductase, iron-sulfur subunit